MMAKLLLRLIRVFDSHFLILRDALLQLREDTFQRGFIEFVCLRGKAKIELIYIGEVYSMVTVDSCSSIWRSLSRSLAFIDARLLLVIDEAYDDAGRSSIDRFARFG